MDADSLIRFANRTYQANLSFGFSYIDGTAAAIDLRQRSNVRYFQRPDGPPGRYDPTRTSLGGTQIAREHRQDRAAGTGSGAAALPPTRRSSRRTSSAA